MAETEEAPRNDLPRFFHVRLRPASEQVVIDDAVRERFRQIVEQIAARAEFEAVVLSASANYVQLILGGLGDRDLETVVNLVKAETARGILADWPVYRFILPGADFWDQGFIYTCHSAETIDAALQYIKLHGDVDLFGKPSSC